MGNWAGWIVLIIAVLTALTGVLSALLTGVWVVAQSSARLREHEGRLKELEHAHEARWETLTATIGQLREELAALRATMEGLRHDETRYSLAFPRQGLPQHRSARAETAEDGAQKATL